MDQFEQLLRGKVEEEINKYIDLLSQSGAEDFSEYKYYCGCIKALRDILVLCDEARQDMGL